MPMQRVVVAVVDDDAGVREAMATLLSALGYSTELFASGTAFLDMAASTKADCLVVDIQLGDISGLELARQLAATGRKLPIIFTTALDEKTIQDQAMALGGFAFLRKPFSAELLVGAIVKAIGHSHTSDG
jgi:FixJ family two-component response regulator